MQEIEIKRRIPESEYAPAGPVVRQTDAVFGPEGYDVHELDPKVFLLRVRETPKGSELNAKAKDSYGVATEYETEVADPEQARKIVEAAGLVELYRFTKERSKKDIDGDTLCVDRVDRLGCFVELERLAPEDADAATITAELNAKLDALGYTGSPVSKGYDMMIAHLERD